MIDAREPYSQTARAAEIALLAAVIVAAQLIGSVLLESDGAPSLFHPDTGIGIGWLLARGRRAWSGVLLGAVLANTIELVTVGAGGPTDASQVVFTSAMKGVADLVAALTACGLARRLIDWPSPLIHPRDILRFVLVVLPVSVGVGTGVDLFMRALGLTHEPLDQESIQFELGRALLGALVLAPLVLAILGTPEKVWRPRRMQAAVVTAVYFIAAWGVQALVETSERATEAEFREQVGAVVTGIQARLADQVTLALALQAFYASSNAVERDEFTSFCAPLLARDASVQAIEWIPRVAGRDRAEFEAAAQSEGLPGFRITERDLTRQVVPVSGRAEYFPVWFVEPLAGNQQALGFDLASDAIRREAIERARKTGVPTATAPVWLVQGGSLGVLLFVPINSNETGRFIGCGLVVCNVVKLADPMGKTASAGGMEYTIVDESAPAAQGLLFASSRAASTQARHEQPILANSTLEFGGRRWSMRAQLPRSSAGREAWWSSLLELLSCVVLGSMAAAHLYLSGREVLIEAAVRTRVDDLHATFERYRQLVEAAPVAMLAIDAKGSVVIVNQGAVELFGYPREQVLGHSLTMLLGSSDEGSTLGAAPASARGVARSFHRCPARLGGSFAIELRESTALLGGDQLSVLTCRVVPEALLVPRRNRRS